jgi:hypothetical protein
MGYEIDSVRSVLVQRLEFSDTFDHLILNLEVCNKITTNDRLELIRDFLKCLDSSVANGFLTHTDLVRFPIISEFLSCFVDREKDLSFVDGLNSAECYKWIYNVLNINLYMLCVDSIKIPELVQQDVLTEFKNMEKELLGRLDSSIRYYLQKRGLSIKENVYIGFDTEYSQSGAETNKLVSSQLAVSCKTVIQIPRIEGYKLSRLDDKSNKLIPIGKTLGAFNYTKVETSIRMCVDKIRMMKNGGYDLCLKVINESLRMIKGLSYYESDTCTLFTLPNSSIQPYISFGDTFSFSELMSISSNIAFPISRGQSVLLMELLSTISSKGFSLCFGKDALLTEIYNVFDSYEDVLKLSAESEKVLDYITPDSLTPSTNDEKSVRRLTKNLGDRVSVTITKSYYLIGHLTQADLGQLSDFDEIKEELSIVNGSFVTVGGAIKYQGKNVHVRDTMLLAPGGRKSLAVIGGMYPKFPKLTITKEDLEDMQGYLNRDRESFVGYALRDAVITLVHALWMDDFNFRIGGTGVPISLSGIGRRYVKSIWKDQKYPGYQISNKYLLGDVSKSMTPKGLHALQNVGFVLPYYIANYKGGRNECFMYGVDKETTWSDYDLTSAYTTVMAMAGHPDYAKQRKLTVLELEGLCEDEVLYSYLIIQADFEFPVTTKYPSIPCYVDENCTVYPLKGSCVITGAEYLLARSQKCSFVFESINIIPFSISEHVDNKPFSTVLKMVQEKRREYPKGTINNLMYKEIGNSIYGSVVRGISDKRKFDIKSQGTVRMVGDDLTNPIIAS